MSNNLFCFTLKQVAEATGLSLRSLSDRARAEKFEHLRFGNRRYMTERQVLAMFGVADARTTGDLAVAADLRSVLAKVEHDHHLARFRADFKAQKEEAAA